MEYRSAVILNIDSFNYFYFKSENGRHSWTANHHQNSQK